MHALVEQLQIANAARQQNSLTQQQPVQQNSQPNQHMHSPSPFMPQHSIPFQYITL